MDRNTESLLEIGTIVGTHGLRGDLKVRLSSGDPDLLLSIEQVELLMPDGRMLALDISRQVLHKGQVLLRFQGYDSINQVESMVSGKIMFAENKLPKLAEDEYYWGQLNGLQVFDRTRGDIGRVSSLFSSAAHDTYVVNGPYGEVMIPAVRQFILEIDPEGRSMKVDLPEGLLPEEQ